MKDTYNQVFDLYVRGKIPEDLYEAKNAELKAEEQDLQEQMSRYSQIDKDIKAISECVLEISGNLRKIFDCSKPVIQNQILRLLVSNTVLSNKKARISLAKPFDLFLKNPDCMMWSCIWHVLRESQDSELPWSENANASPLGVFERKQL